MALHIACLDFCIISSGGLSANLSVAEIVTRSDSIDLMGLAKHTFILVLSHGP